MRAIESIGISCRVATVLGGEVIKEAIMTGAPFANDGQHYREVREVRSGNLPAQPELPPRNAGGRTFAFSKQVKSCKEMAERCSKPFPSSVEAAPQTLPRNDIVKRTLKSLLHKSIQSEAHFCITSSGDTIPGADVFRFICV